MRQFFRQLKVKQKVFVLLAIAISIVYITNTFSNVWVATNNPVQKHISSLNSLVFNSPYLDDSQDWVKYLNHEQKRFTVIDLAIYSSDGILLDSQSEMFPSNLKELSADHSDPDCIIVPGENFILMIKMKANLEHTFILELIWFSTCLSRSILYHSTHHQTHFFAYRYHQRNRNGTKLFIKSKTLLF